MAESVSFWLSVTASFAFVTAIPSLGHDLSARSILRASVQGVLLANVLTLPIIALVFGAWSPLSIVANVLIGPLISIVFPLTFLLALVALFSMPAAGLIAWIPGCVLDILLTLIGYLSTAAGPLSLAASGRVVAVLIAIPCLALGLAMSRDARRWMRIVAQRWTVTPGVVAMSCLGPGLGLAIVIVLQAVTWLYG